MKPRKKDSLKSTSLPIDFLSQLSDTVKEQYKKQLKNIQVITQGRVFENEVLLRVGFLETGRLKQSNFEISFDLPFEKDQITSRLELAVDYLGGLIEEFLTTSTNNEENHTFEENLPTLWKPIHLQKHQYYFQFSSENSELESMANRLLAEAGLDNDGYSTDMVSEKILAEDASTYSETVSVEQLETIIDLKKQKRGDADTDKPEYLH